MATGKACHRRASSIQLFRSGAHVGGVDDGYLPVLKPLAGDLTHQVERIAGHALIGFAVAHQSAAIIR
jgi:hypothetical protein